MIKIKKNTIILNAGVLILLLTSGCVFFNTLYNARVAFKNARRGHEKYIKERKDTSETIPSDVASKYERTITKTKKVLDVYPEKEKWHDDAIILMGKSAYYLEKYDDAIRRFRRLQRHFPNSEYIPESYLFLGRSYLDNDNLGKAEDVFDLILIKYPELNNSEEITFLKAELAIKREGKSQAVELLKKTLGRVKSKEKKMDIIIEMAELYIELEEYDMALDILKKAPKIKDFPEKLFQIDYLNVFCLVKRGEYNKAIKTADVMLDEKRYSFHRSKILLKKAEAFAAVDKLEEAINIYEEIIGSNSSEKEEKALAAFRLAQIYQHKKADFEKALEYYEKAVSLSSDEDITVIAREHINAIKAIKPLKESVAAALKKTEEADSVDSISISEYKIGELYWLYLDEPDSALNHFSEIEKQEKPDSLMLMKAKYAQAWIKFNIKGDTAEAVKLFNNIISDYPATDFAKRSQQQLQDTITIMTRGDSALQAFKEAEKECWENNDPLKASNEYIRLFRKYRDQEDVSARCLYSAAWICENVMDRKKASAFKLYTMLCDTFPESEYCNERVKEALKTAIDSVKTRKLRKNNKQNDQTDESVKGDTLNTEMETVDDEGNTPDKVSGKIEEDNELKNQVE